MPYTVGLPDMTTGARLASQGIQSGANAIGGVLQQMGMMYLKDQQGGAIMDAMKKQGYFDDQPGQPGSAMLPSALYSAAQKGPIGTKSAMAGVMMNFLNMNYQMKRQMQMYGLQHGGWIAPQGGNSSSSSSGGNGSGQPQAYDLSNPPGAITLPEQKSDDESSD